MISKHTLFLHGFPSIKFWHHCRGHFVLEILSKPTNIFFSMFSTSFHFFKHWRTFNIHVNISCKLLSTPVLMDLTRFSLYAITEVLRKPKHAHFNSWFQNIHFSCAVSPDKIMALLPGWERFDFTFLLTFLLYFWCVGQSFLALQKSILAFVWLGKFLYILILCC